MPYTVDNPPERIKNLPEHAQEIFISAFNSAITQYKGDEEKANATAWAAVKTKYEQDEEGNWKARESRDELRGVYNKLLVELGKRNTTADSKRIHAVINLCNELLSDEEPDEEKTREAVAVTNKLLDDIINLPTLKEEDGMFFPSNAYACVPEENKPETWSLRMMETPEAGVTRKQLVKTSAFLSPGGYKGEKIKIPADLLPGAKLKLREAFYDMGVPLEDMPRWLYESQLKGGNRVQEVKRALISDIVPLEEGAVDGKGVAQITVIKPGFNTSKTRYYKPEALSRDFGVFEGVKMYADHPSKTDEENRPERSIRDWVATLKNVRVGTDGAIVGEAHVIEPWLKEKLSTLRDKGMLQDIGVSINAIGQATEAEIEGVRTLSVEKLIRGRSVDFVTEPGAGGGVQVYESALTEYDVDLVTLDNLVERRPDLVKEIQTSVKNEIMKEAKKMGELEEKVALLESEKQELATERDTLKSQVEEAEKAKAKAEAQAKLNEAVSGSELPEPAKTRILERFKDAESEEGIAEAIKAEQDYLAELKNAGVVTSNGESKPLEVNQESLRESWKRMHPEWTEEQINTAVRGH